MQTIVLNLVNGQTMVAMLEKKEEGLRGDILTLHNPFFMELGEDLLGNKSIALARVTTFSNSHIITLEEDKALIVTSPSKATKAVYDRTLKEYQDTMDNRVEDLLYKGLSEYATDDIKETLKEKMKEVEMRYALRQANTSVMH